MSEQSENIPQIIERDERANYLVNFLDHINAKNILDSEESKREFY